MVFESVVVDILNRFLGDYVENLDASQLKLGIWGGDVVLKNLDLKEEALNELDLPIKTVGGHLGKLTLKIPWKNLYTAPVIASIEDFCLLAVPNTGGKYDAVKEEKVKQEAKKKALQRIEDAKRIEAEQGCEKVEVQDSFTEKLVAQIIKNLQITVASIHIRYEDSFTNPLRPFTCGFTLHNLSFETTNDKWIPSLAQDASTMIYKLITLDSLAVYWNCGSILFSKMSVEERREAFKTGIATKNHVPSNCFYVLGPINSGAQLRLNKKPESDGSGYTIPKIMLNVDMQEIAVSLSKFQFQDVMELLQSLERMSLAALYRKYKPSVPVNKNASVWWKFAYTCITVEDIRRRKRNWSWEHMLQHRKMLKGYKEAYRQKLMGGKKIPGDLSTKLNNFEKDLDVFNIVLVRKQAEVEYERLGIKNKPDESYTGWVKSWFSGKKEKQEEAGIVKKLEDAMSAEEKAKLCTAIGYQENTAPTVYPKTFVENKVSFVLHNLTVTVKDDSQQATTNVMKVSLREVSCGIEQRPSAQALKLNVRMQSIVVHGIQEGMSEQTPMMVSSAGHGHPNVNLLDILFETNPLDGTCDQRVHVTANPVEIIYHALTVGQLSEVFKPPESIALTQLQAAAQSALEDVKEMSATGLQHAIEQHKVMDLNIDVKPSYIIIPENGVYDSNSHILLIDLGSVQMKSVSKDRSATQLKQLVRAGSSEDERLKEMIGQSYDRFAINIQQVQILLADPSDDLNVVRGGGKPSNYLLEPTALSVELQKCLITDDPRLPKMKINVDLPSIKISISEKNLLQVAAIALSIPTPETVESDFKDQPQIEGILAASDAANVNAKTVKRLAKAKLAVTAAEENTEIAGERSTTQFTDLEFTFTIRQVALSIIQQMEDRESEMLTFAVDSIGTKLTIRTFDMKAELFVGGLTVQHKQYNFQDGKPLYILQTPVTKGADEKLLSVFFLKANPKSVDFHTTYKSTVQDIRVKFSRVFLALHLEAILSVMAFGDAFTKKIEDVQKQYQKDKSTTLAKFKERSMSSLSTILEQEKNKIVRRRKKIEAVDVTIDLNFTAVMDSFGLVICDNKHTVTDIDIRGLEVGAKIQKSKTVVSAILRNIVVLDPSPEAIYKEILSIIDTEALNANVAIFNNATEDRGYLDMNVVDTSVTLSVGCLRAVFLNKFVSDLMNFVNNFQAAKAKVVEASAAAAEAARQNMQDVYQKASRIGLNILMKAPVVIVPRSSKSIDALVADLGVLTLKNSFRKGDTLGRERNPPIFDHYKIGLENLKLSMAKIDPAAIDIQAECLLLEPCSVGITLVRNLTIGLYKDAPEIDLNCKLGVISLTMTQEDYTSLMQILNDNLAEGVSQDPVVPDTVPLEEKFILPASSNIAGITIQEEEDEQDSSVATYSRVKCECQLESFAIQLYNGSSHLGEGVCERRAKQSLAKFEMKMLALKGEVLSDGTLYANVILLNCLWDDTRAVRTGGITRLLEKTSHAGNGSKSMLDVTYRQSANSDKFLDVKILSFSLVICPDYLMTLGDFFTKGLPEPTTKQPTKTKPSAEPKSPSSPSVKSTSNTEIHFKMEQPDIVVVEDVNDINTAGIIFNNEIKFKINIMPDQQKIMGSIRNFQLITCCYNPEKRAETMSEILRPCEISLVSNSTESDMHVDVNVSEFVLRITPATIRLLTSIGNAFASPKVQDESETGKVAKDFSNTWAVQKSRERNFWFLKIEAGEEATEAVGVEPVVTVMRQELVAEIKTVIVTVEAGVGNSTIPMILLESSFYSQIRNWSSLMQIEASLSVELAYYNVRHASWEPIIEPVESGRRAWELILDVKKNDEFANEDANDDADDVTDGADCIQFLPPVMTVNVISQDMLEVTVTKACLEVLQSLGKIFGEAITTSVTAAKDLNESPYVLKNETGIPITLILKDQEFEVLDKKLSEFQEVLLEVGTSVNLNLKSGDGKKFTKKSVLREQESQQQHMMMIKVNDMNTVRPFSVTRADKRYFPLPHRTYPGDQWGLVTDIEAKYGCKIITLRSTVQIHNHLSIGADVFFMTQGGNEVQFCGLAEPNSILNLPLNAVYTPTSELFFRPKLNGYTVSTDAFVWKELMKKPNLSKVLECRPREPSDPTLYISSLGELEQVYFEETRKKTMSSTGFKIHLRPTAIIQNLLYFPIVFTLQGHSDVILEEGHSQELLGARVGATAITIKIPSYLNNDWICNRVLEAHADELNVWTFEAVNSKISMELGMHSEWKQGTLKLSLYSPFWMMNKTGLDLAYRGDDPLHTVSHPASMQTPVLFSFKGKAFFAKKTASIKVAEADWSDKFSLDAVGSSGIVTCNVKNGVSYEVGVQIKLTNSGLTKIIIFSPRYIFVNSASFDIEMREAAESASWIRIPSAECVPFWPRHNQKGKFVQLRAHGTVEETQPFIYHDVNVTLLRLDNEKGGINVDCQVTEGSAIVTLSDFEEDLVAMRLVNDTDAYTLEYVQSGCCTKRQLKPKETVLYAWEVPSGSRELLWSLGDKKDQKLDPSKDAICEFDVGKSKNAYWVCFLDGMQHVVMFTEDVILGTAAQQAGELERVELELNLSLHGVGLSLVDNFKSVELLYLAIASSGVVWEAAKPKSRRYRPLNIKECVIIETAYQKYLNEIKVNKKPKSRQVLEGKIEVDFSIETMYKPNHRKIRRSFQPGLWFQQKTSLHQIQVHAKINRLQIDDQLHDCVFSTILEPIPPPKSVAADTTPKPFAEVSIMVRKNEHSAIQQYKYFKVLIQEFHVKVDQGFINALINMFSPEVAEAKNHVELFKLDMKTANADLKEIAAFHSTQDVKNYYDLLHFSPLKVHISFSLQGGGGSDDSKKPTKIHSQFINVLLQSVGVTLTELQGIVFRLAFFERQQVFLSNKHLTNEVAMHYTGQAIKQMYVLVLGLDVIGNPFGLVVGLSKGIEDLFYEPFQGAIQGPEEFAEGLALGVKSLLGHAVGGTAGAVSRITGTLGKGIAALTLDDEYQKKRRQTMNRKPATLQEGLAQSGKGLVMGVFDGVTGVFVKPLEGAKEEGVEGFFKGVGKGVVGLVTRPTSGVVDFASGSLDAVKRATDLSDEVRKIRPARYFQSDGIVRPYVLFEAKGCKLLQDVEKGKFAVTDGYMAHWPLTKDEKTVFLVTDKRLLMIGKGEIFGNWNCDWQVTWEEMKELPTVTEKGLKITMKEVKKKVLGLFGSSDSSRIVEIKDIQVSTWISSKIEAAFRSNT